MLRTKPTYGESGAEPYVQYSCVAADEEDMEVEGGLSHHKGTNSFVFTPWDQIATSPLNLPVEVMDFYVTG